MYLQILRRLMTIAVHDDLFYILSFFYMYCHLYLILSVPGLPEYVTNKNLLGVIPQYFVSCSEDMFVKFASISYNG